eukprot:XP_001700831.1 predicted protein [Chlamydomonas reinhardtii]
MTDNKPQRRSCEVVDIDPGWYPGQPELEDDPALSEKWGDYVAVGAPVAPTKFVPMKLPQPTQGLQHNHRVQQHPRVPACASAAACSACRPAASGRTHTSRDAPPIRLLSSSLQFSVPIFAAPPAPPPSQTPLSTEILDSWSLPAQPKHRLTVPQMVADQAAAGRKIGLILDLSNHDCLYTDDVPPDVQYIHIQLVAKELPPPDFVAEVVAAANAFWEQHPDLYIAVHCAYGFNRTGFVVCCYLIECCGLTARYSGYAGMLGDYVSGNSAGHNGGAHHGSPDNSSFGGCSPACRSQDLRDLPQPQAAASAFAAAADRAPHVSEAVGGPAPCIEAPPIPGAGRGAACHSDAAAAAGQGQGHAQAGAVAAGALGSSVSVGSGGRRFSEDRTSSGACGDNESLGVSDRYILQTMRQHAMAQQQQQGNNASIPEEDGGGTGGGSSSHDSPLRGVSSNSLTDYSDVSIRPSGGGSSGAMGPTPPSVTPPRTSAQPAAGRGGRSSLAVQRAQPGAAPAGPTLSDLVRVLDVDTLAAMFNGLTFKELGQIRLACRALREACASFVRRFDVRVNHRTAQNWRPGQRSPLSLFPWCSELKLSISVEKPDPYRDWQAANSDDDDDEQMFRYPADSNYSHHHLARLALAGVRAEALARIRKLTVFNFSMTYGNMGFDLAGVLCALAPQLPALEVLGVSYAWQLAGMKAADRARPTMIYQALAQHCPRLRELRLPAAPGMLHGVDALAACGGLTAFESWESARGHDGAIILGAAEVEALSQLTQLRTLKLRCHDRSAGGAHLVALLGARRWPQLQELKLAASMPQIELTLQPGSGRDIQELWLQPCCTGECGPLAFEAAARVLMAAVDLAPPDAPRSRIHSLRVAGLPVTKHSCSEADAVKCLEPAGHLARLAARCGQVHVEHLDAKRAVSVSALCAVLGVLGMPALLKLQHGFWVVLQELWAGRAQGELADDQPAAPSGHPGPLSGADLRLLQRLLDLDAGSLAQNWRPGQRSPLSLFPWCEDVSISVDTNIWDTSRSSDGESSDDDEGEAGEGYGDSGYGHHHTARLALAGVSAQALGRIRRLTIVNDYDSRRGFDLEAVVCTFVPQLPGLEVLDANDLRLPAVPGMLHGVGALAACAGLAELYCAESFAGWDGPAVLGAAELEGLSQLTQLRTLKLRCHDRSAGGAHLAALLEARRWPQLVCLELAASVM